MADNYVSNFHITTKDDQEFDAQVKDLEAVNRDEGELIDTVVSYQGAAGDTINSFTDFIANFVSGTKIGRWFKNFYAGCQYILHIGSLVNDCVSDNTDLPLAAAQGKVLMDEITQVKSDLTELDTSRPVVTRYGQLNGGSSITITDIESRHIYLLVIGHPNNPPCFYIIVGYSGTNANRVTAVLASSSLTVTEDEDMTLIITCTSGNGWVDLLDLGDSRYAD